MKLLAFAATNSRTSINRQLLEYAALQIEDLISGTETEYLDIQEYEMPIYSPEREKTDGIHPLAKAFFDKIGEADAVLVSFAEHNGFVTAAWKNIFDWMSRIEGQVWQDKHLVFLAATPGPRAGANVLSSQEILAPFFGGNLKGTYGVGTWAEAWDGTTLIKEADIDGVRQAISGFQSI